MANADLPSPELLRKLLDYNPETGLLTWRERDPEHFNAGRYGREKVASAWNRKFSGKVAGSINSIGYVTLRVNNSSPLRAHRIAWSIYYGEWPKGEIDHINRMRCDNRLVNLRTVSVRENSLNRSTPKSNKSGRMGVCWSAAKKRWIAHIMVRGRQIHLGTFTDKGAAVEARRRAEEEFGFTTAAKGEG